MLYCTPPLTLAYSTPSLGCQILDANKETTTRRLVGHSAIHCCQMGQKISSASLSLVVDNVKSASKSVYFRAALFIVIAGWMLWGAFCRQVLHVISRTFREWGMYGTRSRESCRVDYFTLGQQTRVPFSRMNASNLEYGSKTWKRRRHLKRKSEAESEGPALCRKFALDELYFSMLCGDWHDGWKNIVKQSGNLCTFVNTK